MSANKKEIKTAEILCVGTELLLGDIINTNAAYISKELASLGIAVYRQSVIGDNPERLKLEMRGALSRADLVITTGGLGPTCDDLTKETVSELFETELVMDEYCLGEIKKFFEKSNRVMTKNNEKQALVPHGCYVLTNDWGTAPGIAIEGKAGSELEGKTAILLPGPPREMTNMFTYRARPYLEERCPRAMVSRNLHILGMGESAVEDKLRELMDSSVNPTLAPYAKEGEVRLRITASAESKEKAGEMCDELARRVLATEVGKYVYGVDVGSVENAVLTELRRDGETLSVAESCTGGLVSKRITDISGASDVFLGGAVTYANEAKIKMLGVSEETLRKHGAVSEETAIEMSRGIRRVTGSDFGISITGIAGPTGGSEEKPVGTVYISVDSKYGSAVKKLTLSPMRDREYIRMVSATLALYLVLEIKHAGGRAEGAQPE